MYELTRVLICMLPTPASEPVLQACQQVCNRRFTIEPLERLIWHQRFCTFANIMQVAF